VNVEYDHWVHDEWASLNIPSSSPDDVGALLGEMLWVLYAEVTEVGAPGIDYAELAAPRAPVSSTCMHTPRGVVAASRLRDLKRLTERALHGVSDEVATAWCLRNLKRLQDPSTGVWRRQTFKEIGRTLGRDRKTVRRWVGEVDEQLCAELDRVGWRV
jgi:hypothetical protein